MSQEKEIPLFPLNVTLFPHMTLPLHIFEQRYRTMIKDIMDGDKLFGVVLIKSGPEVGGPAVPYSIGTIAMVETTKTLDDGRLNISTKGVDRFRIKNIIRNTPYLFANVDIIPEDTNIDLEAHQSLLDEVKELTREYVKGLVGLEGGWMQSVSLPDTGNNLSYFIASVLRVDSKVKQELLEIPSTLDRFKQEAVILREQVKKVKIRIQKKYKFPKSGFN